MSFFIKSRMKILHVIKVTRVASVLDSVCVRAILLYNLYIKSLVRQRASGQKCHRDVPRALSALRRREQCVRGLNYTHVKAKRIPRVSFPHRYHSRYKSYCHTWIFLGAHKSPLKSRKKRSACDALKLDRWCVRVPHTRCKLAIREASAWLQCVSARVWSLSQSAFDRPRSQSKIIYSVPFLLRAPGFTELDNLFEFNIFEMSSCTLSARTPPSRFFAQ